LTLPRFERQKAGMTRLRFEVRDKGEIGSSGQLIGRQRHASNLGSDIPKKLTGGLPSSSMRFCRASSAGFEAVKELGKRL
jgi:hypothetical protein